MILKVNFCFFKLLKPNEVKISEVSLESIILNISFNIEKSLKQSNPSNTYPILNKLEDKGLISSELKMKNNKQLKYFNITSDGQYVLDYIYSKFDVIHNAGQ